MAVHRVAVTVVALSALVACSSEEPIAPAPLDSTSPEATASATPTEPAGPPPMPDEARGTGRKAAVAFVRHWIELLNYSTSSGDTDDLAAMSSECTSCMAITDFISDVYNEGGSIRSDGWIVEDAWIASWDRRRTQVVAQVESTGQVVVRADGDRERFGGGPGIKIYTLSPGTEWSIVELDQS